VSLFVVSSEIEDRDEVEVATTGQLKIFISPFAALKNIFSWFTPIGELLENVPHLSIIIFTKTFDFPSINGTTTGTNINS
jgi:hypothetical protein